MDIVIDFDGTCVAHEFPKVGRDIGAVPVLKSLVANGHRLILFTMRSDVYVDLGITSEHPEIIPQSGKYLSDALEWFRVNDIPLYGVQTNPTQYRWTKSPKAYGHLIIDDAALGIPLLTRDHKRPYVDWVEVRRMLEKSSVIDVFR